MVQSQSDFPMSKLPRLVVNPAYLNNQQAYIPFHKGSPYLSCSSPVRSPPHVGGVIEAMAAAETKFESGFTEVMAVP